MPIYAYKCESCGHRQDALQKISDPPLAVCPACGAATYVKQLTAAGFQLKGSGWYVTDFRGGNNGAGADKSADEVTPAKPDAGEAKTADTAAKPAADAPAAKPAGAAASAPAPAVAKTPASKSDAPAAGSK
jgi:putative FmdB family regulatory protein